MFHAKFLKPGPFLNGAFGFGLRRAYASCMRVTNTSSAPSGAVPLSNRVEAASGRPDSLAPVTATAAAGDTSVRNLRVIPLPHRIAKNLVGRSSASGCELKGDSRAY